MCDAKIRPLPNDTELVCEIKDESHYNGSNSHHATLRDYAYPGSETTIYWMEEDRRNFRGEWKNCDEFVGCVLPGGHRGNHTI